MIQSIINQIMRVQISEDLMDSISAKFLASLPHQQMAYQRIGYHFLKAYYYYMDLHRIEALTNEEGKEAEITDFCTGLLRRVSFPLCPEITGQNAYKLTKNIYLTVPICGVILLNLQETKALLVESRDTHSLGFPKGKINQDESPENCAERQFFQQIKIAIAVNPEDFVEVVVRSSRSQISDKCCVFYIMRGDEDKLNKKLRKIRKSAHNPQQQQSKKEIKSIQWYRLATISKFIDERKVNVPSRLAFIKLMKKLHPK